MTVIAVLAICGCGASDILVEVRSTRRVPTDVDTLRVTISDVGETDILRSVLVQLDDPFPATVLFEVGEETPERVRVQVDARLGNNLVDSAAAEAVRDGGTTRIRVDLDG